MKFTTFRNSELYVLGMRLGSQETFKVKQIYRKTNIIPQELISTMSSFPNFIRFSLTKGNVSLLCGDTLNLSTKTNFLNCYNPLSKYPFSPKCFKINENFVCSLAELSY